MAIYSLVPYSPVSLTRCENVPECGVWVLGFFDGLHKGHRSLFSAAQALAHTMEAETGKPVPVCCWTFTALPKTDAFLTTWRERLMLLADRGVSYVSMNEFAAVSHLSGLAFWEDVLLKALQPAAVVCGFNFRFGYLGECGAVDLVRWGMEAGVQVLVEKPWLEEEDVVSSTKIRAYVRDGEMELAAKLLDRPYFLTGMVEHGKALGRKLGFPTANIRLPKEKVPPPKGVYACMVVFVQDDETIEENVPLGNVCKAPGVCNIGSRPTVSSDEMDVTVETWLLGFSGDLYGRALTVYLYKKLRDERKFDSLEELTAQVKADGEAVLAWFRENPVDERVLLPGTMENAEKENARKGGTDDGTKDT